MTKKIIILFIALFLNVVNVFAQNVTWGFSSGTLTINGTGEMYYTSSNLYPWHGHRESIIKIVIENGVTGIGNYAFADCSILSEVIMLNGAQILKFGNNNLSATTVFSNTPLLSTLYLGREIAASSGNFFNSGMNSPFHNKTSLAVLTVGDNVTWSVNEGSSGNYLFYGCSNLVSVKLGSCIEYIGNYAFYNCSALTDIKFPNPIKSIGLSAFYNSGLNVVTIPANITFIGSYAFADCNSLTSVKLENGSKGLDFAGNTTAATVFSNSPISTLYLGRWITAGGNIFSSGINSPFHNKTSLKTLTVGDNVTWDENYGNDSNYIFYGCSKLDSVDLGKKIEKIGNYAFYNCSALTKIKSNNPVPPTIIANTSFDGVNKKTCFVFVPEGSKCPYKKANFWKDFENIIDGTSTNCDDPYLIISPEECHFSFSTGNTTITVNSNQIWNVSKSDDWLTISTLSGENNGSFTIGVMENTSTSLRTANVTVSGVGIIRTTTVTQDGAVGIGESESDKLQIFPNPAQTEIFIKSDLQIEKVEIYSITGDLLRVENNYKGKVSVFDLVQGIYFLKVYTEKGVVNRKFVKE